MTLTLTFDLDLEKFAKVKSLETSIKENLPKDAWILCTGHNLLLALKVKSRSSKRSNSLNWL